MKFPVRMLREFVATELSAEGLGDLLTMAGFELEGIEPTADGTDAILDIKVVSNRGDGLSVLGLAREVLAKDANSRPTAHYERAAARFPGMVATGSEIGSVTIESAACTRYASVVIDQVVNGTAPAEIQARLEAAGMRSISLLVDLTNYVMLEVGQPLHAFDVAKLGTDIVVREARPGETLTTLDGVERELLPHHLVIANRERAVAVAGVMGGLDTEVDASTTRVLLESAHFVNTSVRKTRRQLGLSTEASYRFERSVDPNGVDAASRRFIELLREVQPDIVVHPMVDLYPVRPESPMIRIDLSRASQLLGMTITLPEALRYLQALGFHTTLAEPLFVSPPSWRPDVLRFEDVVEELGRVHGYERIPEALPFGHTVPGGLTLTHQLHARLIDTMLRQGFSQVVAHSLRDLHPLDAPGERVGPRQPGSPELAYLRNSLLPGLAEAASRNGARDLHLFEFGRVFAATDGEATREWAALAVLTTGNLHPSDRANDPVTPASFLTAKGVLERLLEGVGIRASYRRPAQVDPRFHPTRVAEVVVSDQGSAERVVGVVGQIHPLRAEALDLPAATILAELDVDALTLAPRADVELRRISRNPAVRRDIAVLMPKSVAFAEIEAALGAAEHDLLESHWLFDVYEGVGIEPGFHSLGIGLQFRKHGGNLTDAEANQARDAIVRALESMGGTLR
ncbi:MAG: phenylalanine--tRNA ligase subunit beta [Fimbriimonadaceae bacterium]|nr:phenylalanine--tRNA ligase subunit beta [Fimbriimonadaceae bacterium]